MKIIEAFIYESLNLSNTSWGSVDKGELMKYVISHPNMADKIYLKVEKDWQEDPRNRLKYPIADKKGTVYRYGLSTALSYAKANNEKGVVDKVLKLYKKFGINESYRIDKYTGYYDTSSIKKLIHWVADDRTANYVISNGIKTDSDGYVYLSEKPLYTDRGHFFEVTIPNNQNLVDWREVWCDDSGNEIDMDHEYDRSNPYFIYVGNIPARYVKLIK